MVSYSGIFFSTNCFYKKNCVNFFKTKFGFQTKMQTKEFSSPTKLFLTKSLFHKKISPYFSSKLFVSLKKMFNYKNKNIFFINKENFQQIFFFFFLFSKCSKMAQVASNSKTRQDQIGSKQLRMALNRSKWFHLVIKTDPNGPGHLGCVMCC